MFGGTKPTFGASTTGTGFGGFNNAATSSPFAQSTFGKPAASTFGAAPTFGTQQAAPSLFGSNTAQPQTSGLFGGASTSTGFGATTTTQPAFGNFAQPQQNTSIFGATQPQANSSSLFGQPTATSAFGSAVKPAGMGTFGATAGQPSTSLFGQPAASTSTSGFGTFGQAAPTTTSVFGSTTASAFGQPANAAASANPGTSIAKYQPTIGTDTLMKGGQANSVNTKQHCITAMKEYESKSLEELRMEDYLANRKGPQAGATGGFGFGGTTQPATGTGLFGATSQPSAGMFGQTPAATTENKGLFGSTTSAFGQPATTGFGATATQPFGAKPFGATGTAGFGATATDNSNPFGSKPAFGQTAAPSLFGQTTATSAAPAFGQTTTGFGGGFGTTAGQQQQQQPSLFGQPAADANKPAFGLGQASTANTGFGGFGTTATSTATGGLFGAKPATGFGTTPAFGATSQATTGFGNFSLNNTNAGGGGLFNSTLNKPATSGFGAFGTQTSTAAPLNFNSGTGQTSLFGNTAAKPGGLFGTSLGTNTNTTGGGLFGQNNQSTFGLGGTQTNFGTTLGGGLNTLGGLSGTPQQQQQVPIHQQILSKVTSPYGDNPIFKDLKRGEENDPTRATNPAAQKAIMETTNSSGQQFKVSSSSSPSIIKVKPLGSALTKKSLFEGLEEFDASVESFSLKPNAKRLILKPKNTNTISGVGSPNANSNTNTPQRQYSALTPTTSNNNQPDVRNESFSGGIPTEPQTSQSVGTNNNAASVSTNAAAAAAAAMDSSRRESWLHPNNLEKVRQHNINAGVEPGSSYNNTLTELVPRKPLDTYRNAPTTGRLSVSTVAENPFEDQTNNGSKRETSATVNESIASSNRSYAADDKSVLIDEGQTEYEDHPTGIVLRRVGYYTIPSLDDLKSFLAEDGSCIVPNFTIGREGYGNVYFGKELDVAGLNLDEIVHFRNKEIIIYPDDDNKPPIGHGLNREAQVTLDQVWPMDKSKHESIKDPQRLIEMDWESKLRRVCEKNDTRFIEYRPETGSWVFRVKHFSKYGLNDSDEEDDIPTDPKKAKMTAAAQEAGKQQGIATAAAAGGAAATALKNNQKITEDNVRSLDPKSLNAGGYYPLDESAEFMLMDKTQFFQNNGNDFSMFDPHPQQTFRSGLTSPTTLLAKDMGTDAHKLQLMKASFFIEDDIDNKSEASEYGVHDYNRNRRNGFLGKRLQDIYGSVNSLWKDGGAGDLPGLGGHFSEASSQMDLNDSLPPPGSSGDSASITHVFKSKQQQQQAMQIENVPQTFKKLPPLIVKPKVAMVKSMASVAPLVKSIAFPLRLKWAADLGLYNSRRFKMGFGPQHTLIVPTTRINLNREIKSTNLLDVAPVLFKTRTANDWSATILQHLKISATQSYDNFKESIADHLQIQLRNSLQQDVEGSECPYIKSDGGTELIVKHLDEAIKLLNLGPLEEYAVSVWSLCLALWGDHEELEGRDPTSHFVVMCRRNLLSEWLENTLTDKDLLTKTVSKHTYLEHLLDLVMCHKVTEACELAFSYDDVNLSLLMSQLSSGPVVRQLMEDQLAAWNSDKADEFIQVERLKLFMLVAGISVMASTHGVINCLEGIEWIKALALQQWYLSSATASITDALLAYEKSFKSEEFYSLPPTPAYMDSVALLYNDKHNLYDLRYHLLQLFSKRSHPLESLLNPATHTSDPMDYRLSWLLLQTLEALGYRHCSELSESQLHVGFAAQLENNDMWEWSIFVLLHIKDKNQRELAVQNVLYRYVSVSKDVALSDKEKFVINNLGVPEKWIDYAKAVRAGSMHNYHLQAKYLLKAKQWSLAHEIIFQHIAPDAVINDNLDYLHHLLTQFESPDLNKSIKVPNWSNQGQIFLDFIDINEKFKGLKSLKTEPDIEARWENLKPQLADLCSRINLLPCPTPKHRLCQSEIAQNLACLVRGVLLVCPILNPCLIIKIALERLPLPQEFAQQELRALLDTLVGDLSKAQLSNTTDMLSVK